MALGAARTAPTWQSSLHIPSCTPLNPLKTNMYPHPRTAQTARSYETIVALGAARTALPWQKCLYMGVLAGIYIGLGGLLLMTVGGACPGERTRMRRWRRRRGFQIAPC